MRPGNAPIPGSQREDVPFWVRSAVPAGMDHLALAPGVRAGRPVRADWRIMSLAYLNFIQREGTASAGTTWS
jgi:hypothetical protein